MCRAHLHDDMLKANLAESVESVMNERRKIARCRTFLGGVIAFNRRNSSMDCVVRNLSPEGARVAFTGTAVIPEKFDLTITRQERSFSARMVWRRPDDAGVAFVAENAEAVPIPLEWAKRLRRCQAERDALRRRIEQLSTAG
jgi:PilZ domain